MRGRADMSGAPGGCRGGRGRGCCGGRREHGRGSRRCGRRRGLDRVDERLTLGELSSIGRPANGATSSRCGGADAQRAFTSSKRHELRICGRSWHRSGNRTGGRDGARRDHRVLGGAGRCRKRRPGEYRPDEHEPGDRDRHHPGLHECRGVSRHRCRRDRHRRRGCRRHHGRRPRRASRDRRCRRHRWCRRDRRPRRA